MKVVAINGSPRKDGNTFFLLTHVLELLKGKGIETELIQIGGQKVQGCLACYQCFKKKNSHCSNDTDCINNCIDAMLSADGILLGSPTYFSNVSTAIKALIDRAGMTAKANADIFRRKVGAGVTAVRRAGACHVFSSLNYFFGISQMVIPGSSYWNLGLGNDKGDVLKDEEGLQTMSNLAENMAWVLSKLVEG